VQLYEDPEVIKDMAATLGQYLGKQVSFEITYVADEHDSETLPSGNVLAWSIHSMDRRTVEDIERDSPDHVVLGMIARQRPLERRQED
jgi:hypothetical protein